MLKQIHDYSKIESEIEDKNKNIDNLNENIKSIQNELFNSNLKVKEHEKAVKDIQGTIEDRDSTIFKLKNLLSRSNKSDQRKQQQIDELQSYIKAIQKEGFHSEEIEKLTIEKEELEEKLRNSSASEEMLKQNQKMQEACDRTSQLYSQLLQDHQELLKEVEFKRNVTLSISRIPNSFERNLPQFLIEEDGSSNENDNTYMNHTDDNSNNEINENVSIQKTKSGLSPNAEKEAKLVRSAYLRRVLLNFFSEEIDANRAEMVPIILELVGCTKEQISVVMRQWERNQHLIARTAGFFGF